MNTLNLFPLVTEKGSLSAESGTYVFKTLVSYDKLMIKQFVEKKFSVKVESVRTSVMSKTKKNKKNGKSKKTYYKKAYVKLAKGIKIPLFEGV